MVISGRTDLASEAHALWLGQAEEYSALPGVRAKSERLEALSVTTVEILDQQGSEALGKPPGRYYTLELPERFDRGAEVFPRAARALALLLRRCLHGVEAGPFLVAALGNPDITPDALGSLAAGSILVTRHLKRSDPAAFRDFADTALCRTGVLGTTGVESAEQIRVLCRQLRPACVIAIDALAGTDLSLLCRTVQVCDTGVAPGSGIGNDRAALDRESLGVPVIGLGVPTVIDAAGLAPQPELSRLFVTPRNIDSAVRAAARLIGYGVDLALHPRLDLADLDLLVG